MPRDNDGTITLFYRSQFHNKHFVDDKHLRDIVLHNVLPVNPATNTVKLHIYYQNSLARSLIMRNSPIRKGGVKRHCVVYRFCCPMQHSRPAVYIGHTRNTLSCRLTQHLQGGNLCAHWINEHGVYPERSTLVGNTTIIASETDPARLKIIEALYISRYRPTINVQSDIFSNILGLFTGHCVDQMPFSPSDVARIRVFEQLSCSQAIRQLPLLNQPIADVDDVVQQDSLPHPPAKLYSPLDRHNAGDADSTQSNLGLNRQL